MLKEKRAEFDVWEQGQRPSGKTTMNQAAQDANDSGYPDSAAL